jgi:ribosomal protein L7Ae-like RNA K-turn-binding protein
VHPSGELVPDVAARLPGRGLWLTPRREVLESAIARRLFARSARRPVAIPPGLADRIENMLVQRCCDLIGLARRAGLAVAGIEKVRQAVRTEKAGVLVLALDGAEGGRRKMRSFGREIPVVIALTGVEMGTIFGRDYVVNIAIGSGTLGGRVIGVAEKITGFRPGASIDRAAEPAWGFELRDGGV